VTSPCRVVGPGYAEPRTALLWRPHDSGGPHGGNRRRLCPSTLRILVSFLGRPRQRRGARRPVASAAWPAHELLRALADQRVVENEDNDGPYHGDDHTIEVEARHTYSAEGRE